MNKNHVLPVLLALTAALGAADSVRGADAYPVRPVRMLVPFSAGSQTDILARWIAPFELGCKHPLCGHPRLVKGDTPIRPDSVLA